jgi:ectoine hydroxylase-related dioxygenase (phytanoyl-CoA dioxygenase family)
MINKNVNFYNKNGYIKIKVFNHNEIKNFENLIKKKIDKYLKNKNWNLSDYHKHIDKENNNKITNTLRRYINIDKKIIDKIRVNKRISQILKNKWRHDKFLIPNQNYLLGMKKKITIKDVNKNEIPFRIVVPKRNTYSISGAPPPHVDLNAGTVIRNKNKVVSPVNLTLWTPIIGFSNKYTLQFAPGSHLLNHPISNVKKISKYISPVFKKKYYQKFKYKRINLKKGEAILFDVNLLHGGAENLGSKTRVNLEFRLYNRYNVNIK